MCTSRNEEILNNSGSDRSEWRHDSIPPVDGSSWATMRNPIRLGPRWKISAFRTNSLMWTGHWKKPLPAHRQRNHRQNTSSYPSIIVPFYARKSDTDFSSRSLWYGETIGETNLGLCILSPCVTNFLIIYDM